MKNTIFTILLVVLYPSFVFSQNQWKDLAVTENTEIYVDSTNIKELNGYIYATTKTIYTTQEARDNYINRIRQAFTKNADKKITKWNDFAYTITHGVYDCRNKRFKIIQIEDYRTDNSRIVRTKAKEKDAKWVLVDIDTVGDFVLFFICDHENR